MRNQHSSVDGFIPRRSGSNLGDLHNVRNRPVARPITVKKRELTSTPDEMNRLVGQANANSVHIRRPDIDESLNSIESLGEPKKKPSRRERRRLARLNKKPKSRARRIIKRIAIFLLVLFIAYIGFIGYKFIKAGGNITNGSIFNILQSQKLKQDSAGRTNFLVLGTSEDDAGHDGANLTDSILVISIGQEDKDMYMFSVPRDLYVDYEQACNSGYSGKINEYFMCSNDGDTKADEQDRLEKTQKFIGNIFGLDIQYGAHINHTVIKEAVNAVGGVDVEVLGSNGDPGVLDRNFDWKCNYKCYYVKYDNGIHHMDGEHALYFAQARGHSAPTYGLGNSNFDREKNQQRVLVALKKKAMSVGTLTNLGAVTSLIDALGNNLRTNVQTSEIRTLMQLANDIKTDDIHSLSLVDENLLNTGSYGGMSVVKPSAGVYVYDDIQEYIKKNLSADPVVREAAPITVLNGTGRAGYGQLMADELEGMGYTIASVNTAPDANYDDVEIYQIGTGNSATAKKLKKLYGVKEIKKTDPPALVTGETKFVVIFGSVVTED